MNIVKSYLYTVLYEPAEEGGFVVTVPALPGLVTQGETLAEARAMAYEAIEGYIESLEKDHLPIPSEEVNSSQPIMERMSINVSVV
jgi:antitoxin HicB